VLSGQPNFLNQVLPPSALQQQVGQTFSQLLTGPSPEQRTFNTAASLQQGLQGVPGGNVLGAAIPVFQQNLQTSADILRQQGPRFASGTQRQVADLSQRSLQDFNLFAQQAIESGLQRQLQTAISGGQFALGEQSQLLPLLQELLRAGIAGSGVAQQPTLIQKPGTLGQIAGVLGSLGGLATGLLPFGGLLGGGGGGAAGGTNPFGVPQGIAQSGFLMPPGFGGG
jgi:hypothetical protein